MARQPQCYHFDIYATRVTTAGVVLDASGIALSTATADQAKPQVAFDGTNCLVVWHDARNGSDSDIYGTRVSTAGAVLDAAGLELSADDGTQSDPALVFGAANYLVVWSDSRGGSNYDVYATRVSKAGAALDADGFAVSTRSTSSTTLRSRSTEPTTWSCGRTIAAEPTTTSTARA